MMMTTMMTTTMAVSDTFSAGPIESDEEDDNNLQLQNHLAAVAEVAVAAADFELLHVTWQSPLNGIRMNHLSSFIIIYYHLFIIKF